MVRVTARQWQDEGLGGLKVGL